MELLTSAMQNHLEAVAQDNLQALGKQSNNVSRYSDQGVTRSADRGPRTGYLPPTVPSRRASAPPTR